MRLGRYDEALARYSLVAAQGRFESYWPYRRHGTALFCLGRCIEAIESYSRAIEYDEDSDPWNLWMRAAAYRIAGQLEESVDDYSGFVSTYTVVAQADALLFLTRHDLARELDDQSRTADAEQLRRRARQALAATLGQRTREAWLPAVLECLLGQRTPSELVQAALKTDDEEWICAAHYYAGEAHLLAGEVGDASRCFRDCVAIELVLDPNQEPPDPWMEYHFARWRLGQLGRAAEPIAQPRRK